MDGVRKWAGGPKALMPDDGNMDSAAFLQTMYSVCLGWLFEATWLFVVRSLDGIAGLSCSLAREGFGLGRPPLTERRTYCIGYRSGIFFNSLGFLNGMEWNGIQNSVKRLTVLYGILSVVAHP